MPDFTHLHVHSEYSLLDGLAQVPHLVKAAKDAGFEALALTDHGTMYGAFTFYQAAKKVGLKPIIGCELYVAPRSRFDRDHSQDGKPYHLTALATNDEGYRNLLQLVSLAQLEGFYYRPRVDREILERFNKGLVVFSGCPSAEVPRLVRDGRDGAAREALGWYRDVFGERYFVEVQNHDIDFLPELTRGLVGLARDMALPLVATNDVHYVRREDAPSHEVLLCIQTGNTLTDPKRMRMSTDSFYLRSADEMTRLFAELPEAISNTARISEMCDLRLDFTGYKLPKFDVPEGDTAASFLARLCASGITERYPVMTQEVQTRLDYELGIIGQMQFDDYFLIVWDLCRFARETGIWYNVRGSGAGSIVAYALRITNVDPLHHKLIFERFLNPSRISMPDIDLDFPDDQRDIVMRYAFRRYGHDRVAQIITFGTMGARAAIRDVGRALDMPLSEVDRVARLIPAISGKPCGIDDVLRPVNDDGPNEFYNRDFAELYENDDEARRLVDNARALEGVTRHASTHAAGVVISDRPLVEYVPLHRPTRGGEGSGGGAGAVKGEGGANGRGANGSAASAARGTNGAAWPGEVAHRTAGPTSPLADDGGETTLQAAENGLSAADAKAAGASGMTPSDATLAITQYAMGDIEKLGLLKVDFLGLATLTILRRAAELVARYQGQRYTLDTIPLDDPDAYALLSSGETTGVFQVESAGLRRTLREMRPSRFEHIVAAIALYRPGPMEYIPTYIARMHGREPVVYRHPALRPILDETYGICVYQESIIQIARDLAGYDAGEADTIRKAVGKKIKAELLAHRTKFVDGAVANGITRPIGEAIFDDIETFARYGFNKAHAADYAVITVQTAYLKAKYPVEYMAALLSVERNNTDKVTIVTSDCHRMGIKLLPPSVNSSELDFTIEQLDDATLAEVNAGVGAIKRRRAIRFGMGAVKNVGEGPVRAILDARAAGGPFADADDFGRRVDLRAVGKRALESLIKVGALDNFGSRHMLLAMLERIMAASSSHHQAAARGQMSLFGDALPATSGPTVAAGLFPALATVAGAAAPAAESLATGADLAAGQRTSSLADYAVAKEVANWEKELIGLYLSEHPLHQLSAALAETVTTFLGDIDASMSGQPVLVAGMVTSVRRITTKKGDPMAFVRIEDLQGAIEVTVFPRVFEETKGLWTIDNLVLVRGKVESRDERLQILADSAELYTPETVQERLHSEAERGGLITTATEFGQDAAASAGEVIANGEAIGEVVSGVLEDGEGSLLGETGLAAGSTDDLDSFGAAGIDSAPDFYDAWGPGPSPPANAIAAEAGSIPLTPVAAASSTAPATNLPGQASTATKADRDSPAGAAVPPTTAASSALAPANGIPSTIGYRLTITLPRSDDVQFDIQLLGKVHQTLQAYRGNDRFRLFIPGGSGLVELDFPNTTTRYCVALLQALEGLVGDGRIEVAAAGA